MNKKFFKLNSYSELLTMYSNSLSNSIKPIYGLYIFKDEYQSYTWARHDKYIEQNYCNIPKKFIRGIRNNK